tara:strand:- start:1541 stop:2656 length:1116 start_codon:yes stop_codon:yes gene_type:complete
MDFLRHIIYDFGFQCFILILICISIYIGSKSERKIYKQIFFNFSAIPIAVLLFELFSTITSSPKKMIFSGTYADNPIVSGPKYFLGYGPKEDTSFQVSSTLKNNDSIVFSVNYSLENGKRLIPNNNDTSNFHVSFIGGSFLFGDGLNDNQTLPFFLNKVSEQKYNLTNYAFSGYGPHQALFNVEKNIINNSQKIQNKSAVIYCFIPSHINRAAGNPLWEINGPQYEFENNELKYLGGFSENKTIKPNFLTKRITIIWRNSQIYKAFFEGNYSNKDIIRTREIINRMHLLLENNNSRFIVLIKRDFKTKFLEKQLYESLKNYNIEIYYIDSIIEDISENKDKYYMADEHPKQVYNKKVAVFLHNKLMQNGRN